LRQQSSGGREPGAASGDTEPPAEHLSGPRVPSSHLEIEQAEHVANLLRLRKGMVVGVLLWPAFLVADLIVARHVQPGTLWVLLCIRFVTWPVLAAGLLAFFRRPYPSPRATRLIASGIFTLATASLALMCVWVGGFRSIYYAGIILVLVCRGAFAAEPWREGALNTGLMVITYSLVLFGSTLFSGSTAAQLADPGSLSIFAVNTCFLVSTGVLTTVAGHVIWMLRKQVFEARSIGRYRLKYRIGSGGMGEVWAAHDKALNRDVAIKILRTRRGNEQAVARFEREVRATTELSHPNTVRVFDFGVTDDGLWYYAMELLQGEDLATLIGRSGALPPGRAVRLLTQAARALAEAHAAGIVHRDIKPENLFVANLGGESDFIKVLDFGVAKLSEAMEDKTLTATGMVMGTPAYVAPETLLGRPADARSDVYALGAVLYAALTGGPPFQEDNTALLCFAHLNKQPVPPSEKLGTPLPDGLEPIVMRCLEKEPERRFGSAAALAASLAEVNVRPQPAATTVFVSTQDTKLGAL
jgi:serine/threonine-protein kinase